MPIDPNFKTSDALKVVALTAITAGCGYIGMGYVGAIIGAFVGALLGVGMWIESEQEEKE